MLYAHSHQNLKILKRRMSGEKGKEEEWPCFRANGLVGVGWKMGTDGRGAHSRASPTPPGFFR